jgi:hypothetical protein
MIHSLEMSSGHTRKGAIMFTDRRKSRRTDSPDRRRHPRPPLWLNLLILLIGVSVAAVAAVHRNQVDVRYDELVAGSDSPAQVLQLRTELSEMDLNQQELARELESRAAFRESLRADKFFLAVDTTERKAYFHYGDRVVREMPLVVGDPATISGSSGSWTFAELKGNFQVVDKSSGGSWRVPEWVYEQKQLPVPEPRPLVPNGHGRYVIQLPNGYVIHSPPPEASPLSGAKPASFMVPEADLGAIWGRIEKGMPVYVF